jgi:curved DNA-binding protein CbpA
MKRNLLLLVLSFVAYIGFGQNVKLEIPIVKTGETQIEVEDENDVVIDTITISISTDDAEQENDEMDTMIDDDIDAGWEGDDFNVLTAGLRFQNITIPQGTTIDSAFIVVTSHEAKTAEDVALLTIVADASDNATTFDMESLITDRTETSASVDWTVDEEWGLWTTHRTPDVKSIVQEMINRSGWESGNAIAFIIKGSDEQGASEFENAREWESFENIADPEEGGDGVNHPERVPKLEIYYTAPSYSLVIPIRKTGETQIEVEDENDVVIDTITIDISTDDAEQENDEMDTTIDDDIDAGWEGDDFNVLTAGMRFQNVTIPQGAVIESAYIEVTSHEAKTAEDVAFLEIVAEASDNAATFDMESLISDRAETTASVDWTVDEEWGLWTPHQTPDLSTIVQELVDRSGWQSGNAIAFIIKGSDEQGASEFENAREWESFENIADPEEGGDGVNHPERVPKLHITFNLSTSVASNKASLENVQMFPNPAKTEITIVTENNNTAQVIIYNQIGAKIKTAEINSAKNTINVSDLESGIYFVSVEENNKLVTQKLIID